MLKKYFVSLLSSNKPFSADVKLSKKVFPFSNIEGNDFINKVSCSIMSGNIKNNIIIETARKRDIQITQ